MASEKTDETDLVDASQLPDAEQEDVTVEHRPQGEATDVSEVSAEPTDHDSEDPFALQMGSATQGQASIASLRERLSAFLVDIGVLWLLYWGGIALFHKIRHGAWIGAVPTTGYDALVVHGSFLLLAFLYFFLFEAAFFATIGKFCCWMYVRRKDGHHAGTFAILIRNFFRLVELATAGLLTWVPMDLSRRHQRLGDMAAGTIVIKKHAAESRVYPLDGERLASAFGRLVAAVIDLAIVGIWIAGYVSLINDQSVIVGQWLVIAFPVVTVLFWTLVQVILETTPGLWIFGYTITHEDGGRLTFAGALLRVITAKIDLVLGLPCILLSLRKQRLGDMIAATVVSRQRRRWKGAIGALVVIAVSVGLVAVGLLVNPLHNVFKAKGEFKYDFLPKIEGMPGLEVFAPTPPPVLSLTNFRFGVNDPVTRRTPPVYDPGETVYLLFEINGYTRKDRMVWIQEDLVVQYPDGSIGLKQENAAEYHQIIKPGGGPIELINNIALPPTAAPGMYVVTVTIRDVLASNVMTKDVQTFTVKAPPVTTSPLEAPPVPAEGAAPPSAEQPVAPIPTTDATGAPVPAAPTAIPTVPSSPIPVTSAPTGAPPQALAPAVRGEPVEPPSAAPTSGGFTVIPGPELAPKETPPPPPPPPVAKALPVDPYGAATKPSAPLIAPPPPVIEKTLPAEPYGRPAAAAPMARPVDSYAKPVAPAVAPAKPTPPPLPPKKPSVAPKTEMQKAAEQELKAVAPPSAKPAAEIPSAEAVKKSEEQKKKKKTSAGSPSGGFMP